MIEFLDALNLIDKKVSPLCVESVALVDAFGRVIAKDVHSVVDLPVFDNSAVDGFALPSDALTITGMRLPIVGSVRAGGGSSLSIQGACAVKVMTGARLPRGTAAVVMKEDVCVTDATIHFDKPITPGFGVRRKGEELHCGSVLVTQGTIITPPVLGLLAAVGVSFVDVFKIPNVAVIVTGDELAPPGTRLSDGQIYESNGIALCSALAAMGINARVVWSRDDSGELLVTLQEALACADLVLTSGGVSVGDFDFVREVAFGAGVKEVFWKVAIKPGKPLFFGTLGEKLMFGLPGNPVSALVTFAVFVAPAIMAMQGKPVLQKWRLARLSHDQKCSEGKTEFARATLDAQNCIEIDPYQGSHMLSGLARSNVLTILPPDRDLLIRGDKVAYLPLPWGI